MTRPISKEELLEKLQEFVSMVKNNDKIIALYLFGSYASGRPTSLSDIDLAVLFDRAVQPECFLPEKLRLMGDLSIILGTDSIDLIVLNQAPPGLGYRVIKEGKLLFARDETKNQLVEFKVRVLDRYFDFLPVQRMMSEGLARRLEEGRFGG